MTRDPLMRLREAKPAADPHEPPPEALLLALTATPRPARALRRPVTSRFVPIVAGAALACGALAIVSGLGGSTAVGPDLAAQAYANSDASLDVIYTRQRLTFQAVAHVGTPGLSDGSFVEDEWRRGDTVHTVTYENGGVVSDEIIRGAKTYSRDPETGAISTSTNAFVGPQLLTSFRQAYQRHTLRERGSAVFDGRAVRRYAVVKHQVARRPPRRGVQAKVTHTTETTEYFLDPKMQMVRGSRETIVSREGAHHSKHIATQTVEAFRKTAPTPAALAALDFHP